VASSRGAPAGGPPPVRLLPERPPPERMLAAGQPTEGRGSGRKDMEGSRHCRTSTTPSHPLQKHAQVVTHHSYPAMSLEAFPTQPPQHST